MHSWVLDVDEDVVERVDSVTVVDKLCEVLVDVDVDTDVDEVVKDVLELNVEVREDVDDEVVISMPRWVHPAAQRPWKKFCGIGTPPV